MFVFVVFHKRVVKTSQRGRIRGRILPKVLVKQTPLQQKTLSRMNAAKWDSEDRDYTIYRISLDNRPNDSVLVSIREACESCGLSGPFYGDGKIAWQGVGSGAEKNVNAKIARQTAETFLRAKLDLLMQIRQIAGFYSFTEMSEVKDVLQEMRERWNYHLTPEMTRWVEYLALKGGAAYHKAAALLATKSQHEAFIGENSSEYTITVKTGPNAGKVVKVNVPFHDGKPPKKPEPFREHGRKMMQSELDSVKACVVDASVVVPTTFDKAKEPPKKEISGTELGTVIMNGRAWDNVLWGS